MPKARVILKYEYELNPENYPEGSTAQEMLKMDEEEDVYEIAIDNVEDCTIEYELVEEKPKGLTA